MLAVCAPPRYVAGLLVLAGCGGDDDEFGGNLAMPLVAQNDSGQDGEATLSEVDSDTTRVVLEVGNPPVILSPRTSTEGAARTSTRNRRTGSRTWWTAHRPPK